MAGLIKDKRSAVVLALILAAGFASYSNSLNNGFVYDDFVVVSENGWIGKLENLPEIFSRDYFSRSGEATYRPVVTASYFLDHWLWGKDPMGFHLTNVLLHLINGILVFAISSAILRSRGLGLVSSAVFVLHPVLTEAVNGIAFREDILCLSFFLGSWLLFRRAVYPNGEGRALRLTGSLVLFCTALLAKETSVVLPAVLALDLLLLGKAYVSAKRPGAILYVTPFFVVSVTFLILRATILSGPVAGMKVFSDTIEALSTIPVIIHQYLRLILAPTGLRAVYDPSCIVGKLNLISVFCMVVIFSLIACAWFLRKREPRATFAVGYFFLTLLPVSHIFFSFWVLMAERFLYMPIISFSLLVALSGQYLYNAFPQHKTMFKRCLVGVFCGIIIAYGFAVYQRNRIWKDSLLLWTDAVAKSPRSALARNNLGLEYKRRGMLEAAMEQFQSALTVDPMDAEVLNNVGNLWLQIGEMERAREAYEKALRSSGCMRNPLVMLFHMAMKNGRLKDAEKIALRFESCFPQDPEFLRMQGLLHYLKGDKESARSLFESFLSSGGDPTSSPIIVPILRELGI
jgi:Flp pilus assembly protein TadD